MRDGRFEENLRCVLTREEVEQRSEDLVKLMQERDVIELELDGQKKAAKARIDALEQNISYRANEVRSRTTFRSVECTERADHERDIVEVVRLDTGEVVFQRPMDPMERQAQLFIAVAHKRGKGKQESSESA